MAERLSHFPSVADLEPVMIGPEPAPGDCMIDFADGNPEVFTDGASKTCNRCTTGEAPTVIRADQGIIEKLSGICVKYG